MWQRKNCRQSVRWDAYDGSGRLFCQLCVPDSAKPLFYERSTNEIKLSVTMRKKPEACKRDIRPIPPPPSFRWIPSDALFFFFFLSLFFRVVMFYISTILITKCMANPRSLIKQLIKKIPHNKWVKLENWLVPRKLNIYKFVIGERWSVKYLQ